MRSAADLPRSARRRLLLAIGVLAAAVGALMGPVPSALMAPIIWSGASAGPSRLTTLVVPANAPPTASASGTSVTVSWNPVQFEDGSLAAGYRVRRYDAAGAGATVAGGCAGTITALRCVELGVPSGVWRYSITALHHGWTGPESARSSAVSVGSATLTFTSSTSLTTLPATLSGTVSGFGPSDGLTFRLDGPTGPVLVGSPTATAANGSASISVTIPAGTDDSPHSVFIVGSSGRVASAAISVVVPPKLTTLQAFDMNGNGRMDRVVAAFDEPLAAYSAGTAPWTLTAVPSGGSLSSVAVSGSTATLTLAEGAGAPTTAVGAFTVALAASGAGIRDAYGHQASFAATVPADRAAPVAVASPLLLDSNANGKVDRVTVNFSESLAAYSAGTIPWTVANVPTGGSLLSVAVSASSATLTLSEGATSSTAVGAMTVALGSSATGVRDAAGNLTAMATVAPTDGARPIRVSSTMRDNTTNGKVDQVLVTFSETLAAYSAGTTPWTLSGAPSGATLLSVAATGPQVTLTLNEGAGTADTAVGTFTVALASNAAGVRDTAANLAVQPAAAPSDGAAPVVTGMTDTNGTTNGLFEPGDTMSLTFSEALLSAGVPTGPVVTLTDPVGAGSDTLTISGLTSGSRSLGSDNYLSGDGTTASWTSAAVVSGANKVVTVTLGTTCSGTGCPGLTRASGNPTLSFAPAPTLSDAVGNLATGVRNQGIRLF